MFEIDPTGNLTTLFEFTNEGGSPWGRLLRDKHENFYGTTLYGGTGGTCSQGCGIVFEFTSSGQLKVLHNFTGTPDGAYPLAGLTMDANGNLFGTTSHGGTRTAFWSEGCGAVFEITP